MSDPARLRRTMAPYLHPETFVFATLADRTVPEDLAPLCAFDEREGRTVIVEAHAASRHALRHEFACRQITLTVHSDLAAVGFIAAVAAALASAGIPCNVVSAFHHDHLFVPLDRAEEAMAALAALSASGPGG